MDVFSRKKRSEIMSKIHSESKIESIPYKFRFLRLRRHPKSVFGKPDFGNKSRKIALFVDGCFWHGHECRKNFPKTNAKYWREKIERNMKRDSVVNKALLRHGWKIIRIWECEL